MFRVSFMSLESEGCRFAFEVAWPGVGEGEASERRQLWSRRNRPQSWVRGLCDRRDSSGPSGERSRWPVAHPLTDPLLPGAPTECRCVGHRSRPRKVDVTQPSPSRSSWSGGSEGHETELDGHDAQARAAMERCVRVISQPVA